MCRQCGCYHTPSSSQHAEIELPARPVPSDRSIPTRKELDKMKKDKAKRDTEAIRRGSIPSFGNNPWEKDLPKFFQMQDQERAEEEERQPVHGQPVHGQPVHGQPVHEQPVHEQPVHGQPVHGQPVHGQPAHRQRADRQRQLEQQDHIGRAY